VGRVLHHGHLLFIPARSVRPSGTPWQFFVGLGL